MYGNDVRAQAMIKMWMGRAATSIAAEHFCSPVTVRRWWKDLKRTGKIAHQNLKRGRRSDCLLTLREIDWLAARILDTPDLYIDELRKVFVHFHPRKSHVSDYVIAQALVVRSLILETRCRPC